jgi:type IV pilus assembly protein PilV
MRNDRGFSLVEVALSLAIFSIGTVGIIRLIYFAEHQANYALQALHALTLAENKLEWFRTRGADSQRSSIQVADFDTDLVSGVDTSHPPYTIQWRVSGVILQGTVKPIEISTFWLDKQQNSHSITLQTMIARPNQFE